VVLVCPPSISERRLQVNTRLPRPLPGGWGPVARGTPAFPPPPDRSSPPSLALSEAASCPASCRAQLPCLGAPLRRCRRRCRRRRWRSAPIVAAAGSGKASALSTQKFGLASPSPRAFHHRSLRYRCRSSSLWCSAARSRSPAAKVDSDCSVSSVEKAWEVCTAFSEHRGERACNVPFFVFRWGSSVQVEGEQRWSPTRTATVVCF